MKDMIITILLILVLLLGFPLLIVYLKDKGGTIGLIVKRAVGGISMLFGLLIIVWVVYNILQPTEEFKTSYKSIVQFSTPFALIGVGWYWLTSKADDKKP